jgi:hypothetical protein
MPRSALSPHPPELPGPSSTRGATMPAHAPHFEATTDLLLVIGVAALVMGLGSLILGLSEADPIPNSKPVEIEVTSTRAADVALNQFSPSSQRTNRDQGGPPVTTARSQGIVNGIEAGRPGPTSLRCRPAYAGPLLAPTRLRGMRSALTLTLRTRGSGWVIRRWSRQQHRCLNHRVTPL